MAAAGRPRHPARLLRQPRHRPAHAGRRPPRRPTSGVVLHTENGMLNMGRAAVGDEIDPDLINAGKIPVTELPGASYFHHADSFAMMRGGHLDVCVLGAFQVSAAGDLANWHTGAPDAIPAVGGAMDLAIGAKQRLRDDDAVRQGRLAQAGARVHLPADRRRLRRPGLHRPSPSSRSARAACVVRRDVRDVVRRARATGSRCRSRAARVWTMAAEPGSGWTASWCSRHSWCRGGREGPRRRRPAGLHRGDVPDP